MHNTTETRIVRGSHVTFSIARDFCRASLLFLLILLPGFGRSQEINRRVSSATRDSEETKPRVTETLIDSSIPNDPDVVKLLGPYRAKVAELEVVIGRLDGELKKGAIGAGSLGNFVTDGLRDEASRKLGKPVPLVVTNSGGLRKNSIAAGELRVRDIFELMPFENALIQIDLTGEQLLRLLAAVVKDRDAQSGAHVTFKYGADNKPELDSATLIDAGKEVAIDPTATYLVVTIDYLYGLGGGRYAILHEGKNVTPLGITMRGALMNYVKSETAKGRPVRGQLDGRFTLIGPDRATEPVP